MNPTLQTIITVIGLALLALSVLVTFVLLVLLGLNRDLEADRRERELDESNGRGWETDPHNL